MYMKTLSVSDINNYIKKVMDNDFILNNACIKGELSNFKIHSSGHIYFSLKDEFSKINCVMFKSYAKDLKFMPENGMKLIVKGRISTYVKGGVYQLYCEHIETEGLGELYIAFEKLKNKLEKEGLFKDEHKRLIPKYSKKIGVITSPTGAAIRDIINVTKRRNKTVEILIYPTLVQGIDASEHMIKGIKTLNEREDIDVIILARGGGSIEELWAFNDERLARAVYNSNIPIITGVGHEVDYTIVDFVSDKRAPTPSAAAEIAVFNLNNVNNSLKDKVRSLNYYMQSNIKNRYNDVNSLRRTLEINGPEKNIVNEYIKIDKIKDILNYGIKSKLDNKKAQLAKAVALLKSNNPLNILQRGYSIIEDDKGSVISKIKTLDNIKSINVVLKDGEGKFKIERISKES